MPKVHCTRSSDIVRTPRVRQLEGMFDVPPSARSELRWDVELPLEERDWQIGLIVGPSGCGKSTLARELFPQARQAGFDWPAEKSIVDAFPATMGIKQIVGLLSSVGFSSPPSWLRPFRVLSNGEQFRVNIARALAETPDLAVIDEFTSVVDRTVARIGSASIAKAIRRRNVKDEGGTKKDEDARPRLSSSVIPHPSAFRFVAISCHYDIIDWLDPDWIYDPASNEFQWRCLRQPEREEASTGRDKRQQECFFARPAITLEIAPVHRQAWRLFKLHHYLNTQLNPAARCFVAFVVEREEASSTVRAAHESYMNNVPCRLMAESCLPDRDIALRPAAFTAVLSAPDSRGGYWREHRTVCLPDFQGVGIGNALSEFVASLFVATGKRYCSRTSHPAMIQHRVKSKLWQMTGGIAFGRKHSGRCTAFNRSAALSRLTAGFRYIGPPNHEAARKFEIVR
jgi:hypothetical protein